MLHIYIIGIQYLLQFILNLAIWRQFAWLFGYPPFGDLDYNASRPQHSLYSVFVTLQEALEVYEVMLYIDSSSIYRPEGSR